MDILEFKTMFKVAKRTASNFDEFCDELELYLGAAKKSAATTRGWWTLDIRGADELTEADLEHIAEGIRNGFTGGEIVADEKDQKEASVKKAKETGEITSDEALQEIARLITDGFTSGRLDGTEEGYSTVWELNTNTFRDN